MTQTKPVTKQEIGGICAAILMRLGKNDFNGVSRLIDLLRTRFDEWLLARPEKDESARRKANKVVVTNHD